MKNIRFYKNESEITLMAAFLATLTKHGIEWQVNDANEVFFEICITGF